MYKKIAAILAASLFSTNASAVIILTANLTNAQEVATPAVVPTLANGAPRPASFGFATFTINDALTSMTFVATIFNIDVTGLQTPDPFDNLTNAHIHASPTVTPGTNGAVVWGFFGSPQNDINPMDWVATPFSSGVGGTFSGKWDPLEGNGTTFAAQLPNILNFHSYINFHTVQFAGGEIRGAIEASEPGPLVLMLGGGLVLVATGARRKRAGRR